MALEPVRGYTIYINLNKGVFLWGLKPDHALYLFVSFLLFAVMLKWLCIPIYFMMVLFVGKIKKQTKLGHPDYIDDLMILFKSSKCIEDTTGTLQHLIKKQDNNGN